MWGRPPVGRRACCRRRQTGRSALHFVIFAVIGGPEADGYSLDNHEFHAAGHRTFTAAALKPSATFMPV